MEADFEMLYEDLQDELRTFERKSEDYRIYICEALKTSARYIDKLKEFLKGYPFTGKEAEINFFRTISPKFWSMHIYYFHVYHMEMKRFPGVESVLQEACAEERRKMADFYRQHAEFIAYWNSGSHVLDEAYFLRANDDPFLGQEEKFLTFDPRFCTTHSFILSQWLAYENLQRYLQFESGNGMTARPNVSVKSDGGGVLQWISSKADLVELLYSLDAAGVFDSRKAGLKRIAEFLQLSFGVDLGNYYRTFQEIRIRKERTKFMDHLREALQRRMDELDG